MSQVITIGMLKGGSGKTTSAVFTALHHAAAGRTVVGLDGDQTSQSMHDWARLADAAGTPLPFEVIRYPFADIAEEVERQRLQADVVVVDAGGGDLEFLVSAATVSDVLLMPLAPSGADARRVEATMKAAERGATQNQRGLLAALAIVRADGRSAEPERWRAQLLADERPLLDTSIGARVLYSRAYGTLPDDVGEYADLLAEVDREMAVTA